MPPNIQPEDVIQKIAPEIPYKEESTLGLKIGLGVAFIGLAAEIPILIAGAIGYGIWSYFREPESYRRNDREYKRLIERLKEGKQ